MIWCWYIYFLIFLFSVVCCIIGFAISVCNKLVFCYGTDILFWFQLFYVVCFIVGFAIFVYKTFVFSYGADILFSE